MKNSELIKVINRANKVITTNPVLPILENFHISNGVIIASDWQNNLYQDIEFMDTFLAPAKQLKTILSKLPKTANIHLSGSDSKCFISVDGVQKFSLNTDDILDFPKIDFTAAPLTKLAPEDIANIKNCISYTSKDELRPAMTGVFLNGHIAATDGHRLKYSETVSKINEPIIIPRKTANLIDSKLNYSISTLNAENMIFLVSDNEQIIFRPIDERYPDFLNVIPTQDILKNGFNIAPEKIQNLVELALIVANKTTKQVKLKIENNSLTLSSEDLDYGTEYKETVKIDTILDCDTFEIGFNGLLLLDTIKELKNEKTINFAMSSPKRAAMINGNNLIMPVMLSGFEN